VGDEKRANELLPKAADALLKMEATKKNPEGADVSLMAARWLVTQDKNDEAQQLFAKVENYGNAFVTKVGILDQGRLLIERGRHDEARKL
jgi:hypothetical protein